MTKNNSILFFYASVPHNGYRKFLERNASAEKIFLLDETVIRALMHGKERQYLGRSFVHAIEPKFVAQSLRFMGVESQSAYHSKLCVISHDTLQNPEFVTELKTYDTIILPYEDISLFFKEDYLKPLDLESRVSMTDNTFLRWNQLIPKQGETQPDFMLPVVPTFLRTVAQAAYTEAKKSSDSWRNVGAILFNSDNDEIIFTAFNKHLPEHEPYIHGDPRAYLNAGEEPDWVTAIHAEQSIFAQALNKGVSMIGKSLYTTTYPCPVCAKMIALSGIKQVYYTEGYSVMEQAGSVMKDYGVEIIEIPSSVL